VPNYDRNGNPKPVWFEAGFPWEVAAQSGARKSASICAYSDWHYIIQRPVT
jgi:hypothetical protein